MLDLLDFVASVRALWSRAATWGNLFCGSRSAVSWRAKSSFGIGGSYVDEASMGMFHVFGGCGKNYLCLILFSSLFSSSYGRVAKSNPFLVCR